MSITTHIPTLIATTRLMSHEGDLTQWVSAENPLTIVRRGEGFVGLGRALRLVFSGPQRFRDAADTWRALVASATIEDGIQLPGSGLMCMGTFAFSDDSSQESVLIVPQIIIGRRGSTSWRTDISLLGSNPSPQTSRPSRPAHFQALEWKPGLVGQEDYTARVGEVISRLQEGQADKVVLARDLVAHAPGIRDWRGALARLVESYPDCSTFAVDGLLGSTPETLARVEGGRLAIRVLAGSRARGENPAADRQQSEALVTSTKDNDEHRFAVNSVMKSLQVLSAHAVADEHPYALKLANVWHLATDIEATLSPGVSSLDAVAAIHPSAAVAGSPTNTALDIIAEMEPFDRGRYAGPVGWMDATGDGEWSIALRCAQWSPQGTLTAYAGAGIVADSDPESELLETRLKFKPVLAAFGSDESPLRPI